MNYRITLPADYDMQIIRERVAAKGRLLDDFPGLGQKAYLMRERGVDGSPVNQYAPFYLWNTPEGMNSFLWGAGFQALCADFGRPVVEHWTVAGFARGPARDSAPRAAARRAYHLSPGTDPAPAVERALADMASTAGRPGVHSTALAVDPRHWELLHFTLWEDTVPEEPGEECYQVLHLSRPELGKLPEGRAW